jgi:serine/threonine-protein kinase
VEALARALLGALAAVHGKGLVHRDLKPGNVLLASGGARLCDFGIAHWDGATTLTASAALLGSLRYMAPEQRAGRASALSDLYALGLVLHEALSGGLPPEVPLAPAPARLRRLIAALYAEAPRARPPSAEAALQLLERRPPWRAAAVGLASATALALAVGGLGPSLRGAPPAPAPAKDKADAVEVAAPAPVLKTEPGAGAEPAPSPQPALPPRVEAMSNGPLGSDPGLGNRPPEEKSLVKSVKPAAQVGTTGLMLDEVRSSKKKKKAPPSKMMEPEPKPTAKPLSPSN